MVEQELYKLKGDGLTLITAEEAFFFFESEVQFLGDVNETQERKKLGSAVLRIRYCTILSISKEEGSNDICIYYKNRLGIADSYSFEFIDNNDYRSFYNFLQREIDMIQTEERMLPKDALRKYHKVFSFLILLITIPSFFIGEQFKPAIYFTFAIIVTAWVLGKTWHRYADPPYHIKFTQQQIIHDTNNPTTFDA